MIEAVTAHVEAHIGPIGHVWHDLVSDTVHVDLLWVRPGPRREFHTLVTCGMSERPMDVPEDAGECRHAELVLRLPADWGLPGAAPFDEKVQWPLVELTQLARLPHILQIWLWAGCVVANGEPPSPLAASVRFAGTALLPLAWLPPPFHLLDVDDARTVHFFSAVPLYPEELRIAFLMGREEIIRWLEQAGIGDLLDVHRPSAVGVPH